MIQKILPFDVNLIQVIGPKIQSFVKLSQVKLFLWVKKFNWAQTKTSNSSSTVSVRQWYFENRNTHFYRIREEGRSGRPPPTIHLRTDDVT